MKQIRRLIYRAKSKDFLLSENRSDCSVVTIAKPKDFNLNVKEDVFLSANDRNFVEQEIIQKRNLAFYEIVGNKELVEINLETDNILKRRNSNELQAIIENVESERTRLQSVKEQNSLQIHTLETKSKWLDWFSKFGEKIEKMQGFSEQEKQLFLRGVIEKITVSTLDKQAHEVLINFKIPYVNDTFEWKNSRAKGQGYKLGDGQKEVSVDIDSSKKTPILKK